MQRTTISSKYFGHVLSFKTCCLRLTYWQSFFSPKFYLFFLAVNQPSLAQPSFLSLVSLSVADLSVACKPEGKLSRSSHLVTATLGYQDQG